MVITCDDIFSRNSQQTFYNTGKYIFFIFDSILFNIVITIYNIDTEDILAYEVPNNLLTKNYKKFNIPFFNISIMELLNSKQGDARYEFFVIQNDDIIDKGDFIIKNEFYYDLYGKKDMLNELKGIYIEKLI